MQNFGIGEIARLAGVATSTIRYYEGIGLLPPSKRVSGKRRYGATILEKLRVIRMAQRAGFSIAEIHTLLHEFPANTPPSSRWQTLATNKIPEIDAQIQHLQKMKLLLEQTLSCQCVTLEACAGENDAPCDNSPSAS
ncbi:MAG TPA: MerR family transcriptional regulator [Aggregatilineales bacterium]|nr:MerR family transcriptional regulator [Aggregatilineales bacterium]